jgi:hypothetical protein
MGSPQQAQWSWVCVAAPAPVGQQEQVLIMGERVTNVHDDLTGKQRARLCIITTLIDDSTVAVDSFDLLRYAHWVDTGRDPDGDAKRIESLSDDAARWSPAVQ